MIEVWGKNYKFEAVCEIYNPRIGFSFKVNFVPIIYRDQFGTPKPLGVPLDRSIVVEGSLFLAGFGITKENWDDYKGEDAEGKIVVVLNSVPNDDNKMFPEMSSLNYKVANALDHGAMAVVSVNNPLRQWNNIPGGLVTKSDNIVGICVGAMDMMLILCGEDSEYGLNFMTYQKRIEESGPLGLVSSNLEMKISFKGNMFLKSESSHFIYFYREGSLAQSDIFQIIQSHEKSYLKIAKVLGIELDEKIRYLLFPSAKEKQYFTGHVGAGGTNNISFYEIYNQETKVDAKHELSHIIAGKIGSPPALFSEGLAVWFEEKDFRTEKTPDERVREIFQEGNLIPLNEILSYPEIGSTRSKPTISYPEAGSFVKYLIEEYGFKKFKLIYTKCKREKMDSDFNKKIFEEVYKESIHETEKKWLQSLEEA